MQSVRGWTERLKASGSKSETDRGMPIWRLFRDSERYLIDFATDFTVEGWEQFDTDQDAAYFGVWVNPQTLTTLTYAEGDWSVVQCSDKAAYNAEIQSMLDFYGEGFVAKAFDGNSWETLRQDRTAFLIA